MTNIVLLAVLGAVAQLIDGSLGMAYGATSTSLLLIVGLTPAAASASVHLAEVGTTLASGTSHWRFGNVDWRLVGRLGVPGALGAFLGATVLSSLSTAAARPVTAGILLMIGLYLLVRFSRRGTRPTTSPRRLPGRFLTLLGLVAGFVDATGGGGWGPVSTPALLVTDRVEPRKAIGSVDTSEFLVACAASVGFLLAIGPAGFRGFAVAGLLAGGLVAAPLAAWLVRKIPPSLLGASVGGLLVLTNTRLLLSGYDVPTGIRLAAYVAILLAWATAVAVAIRKHRTEYPQRSRAAAQRLDAAPQRP